MLRILRILRIEDDAAAARALGRLLILLGAGPITRVATVARALAALQPAPDRAILDMNLPEGDGAEVLAAIRAAGLATRVVMASASIPPDRIAEIAALEADLMAPKPIDIARLARVMGLGG